SVRTRRGRSRGSSGRGSRAGPASGRRGVWLSRAWGPSLTGPLLSALFSLLETVGIAVDGDDLGVVDEAVDQRDDAGGAGEHLVPVGERAVGGDQGALGLVASADQLEQHVGVAVGVGEIADLVDDQEGWGGVMAKAAAQSRGAVDRRQISEQLAGAGEQGRMALQDRLMGDVAGDGGFVYAFGADHHGVAGVLEEVESHQRVDGGPVAAGWP